ncbi:MAG: glycosyltransferase [Aquificaceae bacterium]|nr:glycosyltransferase [Aquificaceae bacterium]
MKILILTSSFGGGHNSVAKALRRAFEEHSSVKVRVEDVYHLMNPKVNRFNARLYVSMMKHIPKAYGLFYDLTYDREKDNIFNTLFSLPGLRKLEELLEEEKPDGVVAVYPTYAGMLKILKRRGFPVPKSFVVITDFVAHVQWFHDHMDVYFLPSKEVEFHLYRKGVLCQKVEVTGIPINPEFDLHRREERDLILISAGMFGMTPAVEEICEVVQSLLPKNLRGVVLCGADSRLCHRLRGKFSRLELVQGVLSHEEMAKFMGRSALLISKAGGITTSEALSAETPHLVYKPLPGQEYYNALYLLKNEAGMVAHTKEELARVLRVFLTKEELREGLRENIRRLRKPHSALSVARGINDVLRRGG